MQILKQIIFTAFIFNAFHLFGQTSEIIIPFYENKAGVLEVDIELNEKGFRFIFDTGASAISFGMDLYNKLLADGTLNKNDVIARTSTTLANGSLAEVILIKIAKFSIGGVELYNVDGMVIKGKNVPSLLGQSVLEEFGIITIDNKNDLIKLTKSGIDVKLVPCNQAAKIEIDILKKNLSLNNKIKISSITEEKDVPNSRVINRIKNKITIRYFSLEDYKKVNFLKSILLDYNYKLSEIELEDMTIYFKKNIPNYIEIWIR